MDLSHLAVQLLVAIASAGLANILIPRRIPGGFLGLIVIGLLGAALGEKAVEFLKRQYGISNPLLHMAFQGVEIIPAIFGSLVVLFVVTHFIRWGRYNR